MTSAFDFIEYMREVAETLYDIQHTESEKHFCRVGSVTDLSEFLTSMRTSRGYQLVVMDNKSGRFLDYRSDNLLVQPYYSFFLLKQTPREDYDTRQETIEGCVEVLKKILAKMFRDKRNDLNGLTNLMRDTISYQQVGPFGHNWIGLNVNFMVTDDSDIVYDEDDWITIS